MGFPTTELRPSVQLFLNGQWVEFADTYGVGDDVYVDRYTDSYEGRETRIGGRLLSQTIELRTGMEDEFSATPNGRCSFVLENLDGHVTPKDPRGPYWPDLGRDCLCRVSIEGSPRFFGRVTEMRPTWPEGGADDAAGDVTSFVTVVASGVLQDLAQRSNAQSPLYRSVIRDSTVKDYWPAEEGVYGNAAQSALPGSQPPLRVSGAVQFGADATPIPGASSMAEIAAGNTGSWEARLSNLNTTGWIVGLMFQCPTPPDDTGQFVRVLEVLTSGNPYRYVVDIVNPSGTPLLHYQVYSTDGSLTEELFTLTSFGVTGTTDAVLMELEVSQSGGNVEHGIIWSGLLAGVAYGIGGTPVAGTAGHPSHVRGVVINCPQSGFKFGQIMSRTGTGDFAHASAAAGHNGEGARTRMSRLFDEEEVAFSYESTTEASVRMGPQPTAPVLEVVRQAVAADGGLLFEEPDSLDLHYILRRTRYNRPVAMTLDAASNEIDVPLEPVDDDQGYTNQVTVTRTDGGSYTWPHDAPDRTVHTGVELNLHTDILGRDAAGWVRHLGAREHLRVTRLTINLSNRDEELVSGWKAIRLGDRVRVINLPPQWPTGELDLVFVGWEEPFNAHSWIVTANCIPFAPWQVGVWESSVYGRVDTDGCTLGEPVDDNDTSFDVDNVLYGWSDADGDFDIYVDGEVMTVTAISGDGTVPGSTQTFTVTRGVTGFSKAHSAGAAVVLAHPMLIGR